MTRRTFASSFPWVIFCKNSSNRCLNSSTVQGASPSPRSTSRSGIFTRMAIRPDSAACIPWTRSLLILSGKSLALRNSWTAAFCLDGSRSMLFLAVGSVRLSSSVLRPLLQQAVKLLVDLSWSTAEPVAPSVSSWGRKLQCGQIGWRPGRP